MLLQTIAAAVTPVVMLSAVAVLIMGVNTKHAALSDRMRSLAAEHRSAETVPERRRIIEEQSRIFLCRARYAGMAHLALYLAAVLFIATVLSIALSPRTRPWDQFTLALFLLGTLLMFAGIVAELFDLRLANRTLRLEVRDVL